MKESMLRQILLGGLPALHKQVFGLAQMMLCVIMLCYFPLFGDHSVDALNSLSDSPEGVGGQQLGVVHDLGLVGGERELKRGLGRVKMLPLQDVATRGAHYVWTLDGEQTTFINDDSDLLFLLQCSGSNSNNWYMVKNLQQIHSFQYKRLF